MGHRGGGAIRASAVALALALLVGSAAPSHADFHIQGVGVATDGRATAAPPLSDAQEHHTMSLQFDAVGATYFVLRTSTSIAWDCSTDAAEDGLPPDQRHGFTLTSTDLGDSSRVGKGTAVGRCTGTTAEYPDDLIEITCSQYVVDYVRVGPVIVMDGYCLVSWSWMTTWGFVVLTTALRPTSPDSTSFGVAGAAFHYRG